MEIKEGIIDKVLTVDYIKKFNRSDVEVENCSNVPIILEGVPNMVVGIINYVEEIDDEYIRITMDLWYKFIQNLNFEIYTIERKYDYSSESYIIDSVVIRIK